MKVLFLDIDGVLKLFPEHNEFHKPSIVCLEMLLNRVPDLKIVVDSSHRALGLPVMKMQLGAVGIDPRRMIDITGHEQSPDERDHRGYQVDCWLARHPEVTHFAILDDKSDFSSVKNKLVQTDSHRGLSQSNVEKVLEILEEK